MLPNINPFSTRPFTSVSSEKKQVKKTWIDQPPKLSLIPKKKIETFDPQGEELPTEELRHLRTVALGKGPDAARAAYELSQHYHYPEKVDGKRPTRKKHKREFYWLKVSELKLIEYQRKLSLKSRELDETEHYLLNTVTTRLTKKHSKIGVNMVKQYLPAAPAAVAGAMVLATVTGPVGWAIGGAAVVAGSVGLAANCAHTSWRGQNRKLAIAKAENDVANSIQESSAGGKLSSSVDLDDDRSEISQTGRDRIVGLDDDDRIEIPR